MAGIRPQMTLAQARALCANIEYEPSRPDLDQHALEALARYLIRFTPVVALTTHDIAESASVPSSLRRSVASSLFLDLTGCEHLFGGLSAMVRQIAQTLHRFRIPATLAVAATPGAAFALSCMPPKDEHKNTTGVRTLIAKTTAWAWPDFETTEKGSGFAGARPTDDDGVDPTDIASQSSHTPKAIAQAPLAGLRLPDDTLESLHHLGIETIGQLLGLPRKTLPARFGQQIIIRLDQLTGQIPEPLIPIAIPMKLEEHFDFDGSVCDPQVLELTFNDLLAKLLLRLEKQGQGIRELEVSLCVEHESPWNKMEQNGTSPHMFHLNVSRPTRNGRSLLGLYRCAMDEMVAKSTKSETRNPKQKRRRFSLNFDAGFTCMQLTVIRAQPLPHQQLHVHQSEAAARQQAWQHTLDLIATRLGEGSIEQAELEQSYLPEKAYKLMPASLPEVSDSGPSHREAHARGYETTDVTPGNRPLRLHPPQEVKVMVAPSPDEDGIPLSFSYGGALHKITQAAGPERIGGQWWEGHTKTRDYFDVADDTGSHYWLFRVQETGKWYLQGEFE